MRKFHWAIKVIFLLAIIGVICFYLNVQLFFFGLNPFLNQLESPADYTQVDQIKITDFQKTGTGKQTLILIPGLGMTKTVYTLLVESLKDSFLIYSINLPGIENKTIPLMGNSDVDYFEQYWFKNIEKGIVSLMEKESLKNPIIVGYFMVGGSIAMRLAIDYPDRIRAAVVIAGEPKRFSFTQQKRREWINGFLSREWFKFVPRSTWNKNVFPDHVFSVHKNLSKNDYQQHDKYDLPILIRYTIEANAFDLTYYLDDLKVPILAIRPNFDTDFLADPSNEVFVKMFEQSWDSFPLKSSLIALESIQNARLGMIHENTTQLTDLLTGFVTMLDQNARLAK